MNFYIGSTIDEIDEQGANVEFSDELIGFIYKLKEQVSIDMSKLYEINPYDDVQISVNDLYQIIEVCNYIIDKSLLRDYVESVEGNQMLLNLIKIAKEAMSRGRGLVSIGD